MAEGDAAFRQLPPDHMRAIPALFVAASTLLPSAGANAQNASARLRFAVTFPAERSATPLDGRLLLMISADTAGEPRSQVSGSVATAQVFGVDVDGWKPGETR